MLKLLCEHEDMGSKPVRSEKYSWRVLMRSINSQESREKVNRNVAQSLAVGGLIRCVIIASGNDMRYWRARDENRCAFGKS